jgi:hypothetical protein
MSLQKEGGHSQETKINDLELERLEMERAIVISMALKEKIDEEEEKRIQ